MEKFDMMNEKKKPSELAKTLAIAKSLSEVTEDRPISISRTCQMAGAYTKSGKAIPFYDGRETLERFARDGYGVEGFKAETKVVEHGQNKEILFYPSSQYEFKQTLEKYQEDPLIQNQLTGLDLEKLKQ